MSDQAIRFLEGLLARAGQAHHTYEQDELNGEYDREWPRWYAAFLIEEDISALIQPPPPLGELAEALQRITKAHEGLSEKVDWSAFAAEKLAEQYLTSKG